MKNFLIVLLLVINVPHYANSQVPKNRHLSLLVGHVLLVNSKPGSSVNYDFYEYPEGSVFANVYNFKRINNIAIGKDSIGNLSFKCVETKPWPHDSRFHALILENPLLGKVVYKYDLKYPFQFDEVFKVKGNIVIPKGFYCEDIIGGYDKIDRQTTYSSPLSEMWFMKIIKNGASNYYLCLRAESESLDRYNGFIILFKDGSRMSKPAAKVDIEVNDEAKFEYTTIYKLLPSELTKLTTGVVTDFKIGIERANIKDGVMYREYLKCLINKK
ncbi:hypothetical protein [Rufibacter immobilis]|uniref:hypothetical protein n=1 Tax=Rufibacter immobilis TaxID=1348778 RepID=UPI0035EC3F17